MSLNIHNITVFFPPIHKITIEFNFQVLLRHYQHYLKCSREVSLKKAKVFQLLLTVRDLFYITLKLSLQCGAVFCYSR